jgi:hypothetical protein
MMDTRRDARSAKPARTGRLPRKVCLPSGRIVQLDDAAAREASARVAVRAPVARAFEILSARGVLSSEGGDPVDAAGMDLRDAHVLRAMVCRAAIVDDPPIRATCQNCGESAEYDAASAFEPGPFVDGELDDPELDRAFDLGRAHPIAAVFTPSGIARSVRLAPRTVGDVALLARATKPIAISRAVVVALGIVALGRERRGGAIARSLSRAGDDAWSDVANAYEDAHYSPRLRAEVFCKCGARLDLPFPSAREIDAVAPPMPDEMPTTRPEGFPTERQFEEHVREAAKAVFRARGVRNVDVVVDVGVPACDDGGEPLLGSYVPGVDPGGTFEQGPEVRLYYRTFQSEFAAFSDFDVRAEIHETLDHEVTHHLHHLSGDDPLDDEERDEIARDRARVVGRKELARRAVRGAGTDFLGFLRVGWPLLLIGAAAVAIRACTD